MPRKDNKRVKKMKTIIYIYRFICIALIIMLFFSINVKNNKKEPVVVKKEVINPNIVMLGDSITDYYDLDKYFGEDKLIVNSGISGNKTSDILSDMKNRVYRYNPSKVFLLIGINNFLHDDITPDEMVNQIDEIVTEIHEKLPNTIIYIESIYPVNDIWKTRYDSSVKDPMEVNRKVRETNLLLRQYCKKNDYKYINVYSSLIDDKYSLKAIYSDDGLHPNENGYEVITKVLKKYM